LLDAEANVHRLHPFTVAVLTASAVARHASLLAFNEHHRSMTTPNIMNMLGRSFYELIDDEDDK
jgi:hypothetical protein